MAFHSGFFWNMEMSCATLSDEMYRRLPVKMYK